MRVGFLVTARLKSTRLPRKLLLEVNGEPIVTWLIRRLKLASQLDEIVIATSTNPEDQPLADIAAREGISVFRGSEEDVSGRLYEASRAHKLDYFLSMTADCPFLPYEHVGLVLDTYRRTGADLVTHYALAPGLYLSGVKPESMARVNAMKASDRTEYWLYYYLKTNLFKVAATEVDPALVRAQYRFVLDYPEDFEFLRKVYQELGPDAYRATVAKLVATLDAHPEWAAINAHCQQKMQERTDLDPNSAVRLKDGQGAVAP